MSHMAAMTATEILPNLFLGARADAEALGTRVPDDWACLSVTEYRSRYNRTEELPREPDGSLDMPFMADRPNGWHADPHKLDLIAETIWWRLQTGKKVLVHCIHGQERGPLAVTWYLAWSGEAPSITSAYATVAKLHPRTERRDKWLRGALPKKRAPELQALLNTARFFADAKTAAQSFSSARSLTAAEPRRGFDKIDPLDALTAREASEALEALETAAIAWARTLDKSECAESCQTEGPIVP